MKNKNKEKEIVDLDLKKNEVDKLEKTIENLRNYGFAHIEIGNKLLLLSCQELIDNFEKYEDFLVRSGLTPHEINQHIKEMNKD